MFFFSPSRFLKSEKEKNIPITFIIPECSFTLPLVYLLVDCPKGVETLMFSFFFAFTMPFSPLVNPLLFLNPTTLFACYRFRNGVQETDQSFFLLFSKKRFYRFHFRAAIEDKRKLSLFSQALTLDFYPILLKIVHVALFYIQAFNCIYKELFLFFF